MLRGWWPSQVQLVHRGRVALRGVPEPVSVMMLIPLMLSGRTFPEDLPGGKAKLLSPGAGLQCSVKLPAER